MHFFLKGCCVPKGQGDDFFVSETLRYFSPDDGVCTSERNQVRVPSYALVEVKLAYKIGPPIYKVRGEISTQ